jgi:hypothetical protein
MSMFPLSTSPVTANRLERSMSEVETHTIARMRASQRNSRAVQQTGPARLLTGPEAGHMSGCSCGTSRARRNGARAGAEAAEAETAGRSHLPGSPSRPGR